MLCYLENNDTNHRNRVTIWLNKILNKAIINFVNLKINIIQIYAPTTDKSWQELEKWYNDFDSFIKLTNKNDINGWL